MRKLGLKNYEFQERIGYTRDHLNYVLKKDEVPNRDFLVAVKKAFPEVSMDYMVTGKGPMLIETSFIESATGTVVDLTVAYAKIVEERDALAAKLERIRKAMDEDG